MPSCYFLPTFTTKHHLTSAWFLTGLSQFFKPEKKQSLIFYFVIRFGLRFRSNDVIYRKIMITNFAVSLIKLENMLNTSNCFYYQRLSSKCQMFMILQSLLLPNGFRPMFGESCWSFGSGKKLKLIYVGLHWHFVKLLWFLDNLHIGVKTFNKFCYTTCDLIKCLCFVHV